MKKKIALLLSILMCFPVFGIFGTTAAELPEVELKYGLKDSQTVDSALTTLAAAIAKVNQLAVSDTVTHATITLKKDISTTKELEVSSPLNVTIEGNGNTVSSHLTGEWKFTFSMKNSTDAAAGMLTLNNVNIVHTTTKTNTGCFTFYNGNVTVNNCNFVSDCYLFNFENSGNNSLTVNGGTYISRVSGVNGSILNTGGKSDFVNTVKISGATLITANVCANVLNIARVENTTTADVIGRDDITFENCSINALNAKTVINAKSNTESTLTFNGCTIRVANTAINTLTTTAKLTFNSTTLVGGRNNGYFTGTVCGTTNGYLCAEGDTVVLQDGASFKKLAVPKMSAAASVRLDIEGIRFRTNITSSMQTAYKSAAAMLVGKSEITADDVVLTYGTVVALQSELDKIFVNADTMSTASVSTYNLSKEILDAFDITYLDIVATSKGTTIDGSGNMEFRALVTNIPEGYYDTKLATFSYVKATVDGEEFYFYSTFNPSANTHNIKDVAQQAIDNGEGQGNLADLAILQKYAGIIGG